MRADFIAKAYIYSLSAHTQYTCMDPQDFLKDPSFKNSHRNSKSTSKNGNFLAFFRHPLWPNDIVMVLDDQAEMYITLGSVIGGGECISPGTTTHIKHRSNTSIACRFLLGLD